MTSIKGFSKCMLLLAYVFGLSAVAKMVSVYADSVGREKDFPSILIVLLIQLGLCATGMLIHAWHGVDKSSAKYVEDAQVYERRQYVTRVIAVSLSSVMWLGYLY